jgi:hypothetical protein
VERLGPSRAHGARDEEGDGGNAAHRFGCLAVVVVVVVVVLLALMIQGVIAWG